MSKAKDDLSLMGQIRYLEKSIVNIESQDQFKEEEKENLRLMLNAILESVTAYARADIEAEAENMRARGEGTKMWSPIR